MSHKFLQHAETIGAGKTGMKCPEAIISDACRNIRPLATDNLRLTSYYKAHVDKRADACLYVLVSECLPLTDGTKNQTPKTKH